MHPIFGHSAMTYTINCAPSQFAEEPTVLLVVNIFKIMINSIFPGNVSLLCSAQHCNPPKLEKKTDRSKVCKHPEKSFCQFGFLPYSCPTRRAHHCNQLQSTYQIIITNLCDCSRSVPIKLLYLEIGLIPIKQKIQMSWCLYVHHV